MNNIVHIAPSQAETNKIHEICTGSRVIREYRFVSQKNNSFFVLCHWNSSITPYFADIGWIKKGNFKTNDALFFSNFPILSNQSAVIHFLWGIILIFMQTEKKKWIYRSHRPLININLFTSSSSVLFSIWDGKNGPIRDPKTEGNSYMTYQCNRHLHLTHIMVYQSFHLSTNI